jgi:hypothetical protein
MGEKRKITVSLPTELVEASLRASGKGLTETVSEALAQARHRWASQRLLEMRGKVDLQIDLAALREDK